MAEHVSAVEIADLMGRIRSLQQQHPIDLVEQAAVRSQGRKLLARITDQRIEEWGPCEETTQVREVAREAKEIAEDANRLASLPQPGEARTSDASPRSNQRGRRSQGRRRRHSMTMANHGWHYARHSETSNT